MNQQVSKLLYKYISISLSLYIYIYTYVGRETDIYALMFYWHGNGIIVQSKAGATATCKFQRAPTSLFEGGGVGRGGTHAYCAVTAPLQGT